MGALGYPFGVEAYKRPLLTFPTGAFKILYVAKSRVHDFTLKGRTQSLLSNLPIAVWFVDLL